MRRETPVRVVAPVWVVGVEGVPAHVGSALCPGLAELAFDLGSPTDRG